MAGRDSWWSARASPVERRALQSRRLGGEARPCEQPGRGGRPPAAGPLQPQVAVRAERLIRVASGVILSGCPRVFLRRVEQVCPAGWPRPAGRGHRIERQPAQQRPRPSRIRPPAAEQQPVHRRDIPARRDPQAAGNQQLCGLLGPGDPPRPDLVVRLRDLPGRGRPPLARHRDGASPVRCNRQPDQAPAPHALAHQPCQKILVAHGTIVQSRADLPSWRAVPYDNADWHLGAFRRAERGGAAVLVLNLVLIGVAVALDPLPLTAFFVVLPSQRGTVKGAAFVFGWLISLAAVVTITVAATGNNPPRPATVPSLASLAIKVALGVFLVRIALQHIRARNQPKPPKKLPKWQEH